MPVKHTGGGTPGAKRPAPLSLSPQSGARPAAPMSPANPATPSGASVKSFESASSADRKTGVLDVAEMSNLGATMVSSAAMAALTADDEMDDEKRLQELIQESTKSLGKFQREAMREFEPLEKPKVKVKLNPTQQAKSDRKHAKGAYDSFSSLDIDGSGSCSMREVSRWIAGGSDEMTYKVSKRRRRRRCCCCCAHPYGPANPPARPLPGQLRPPGHGHQLEA
jgi:hypothetical protein